MKTFDELVFMIAKIETGEDWDEFKYELDKSFKQDVISWKQYDVLYTIAYYTYKAH